MVSQLDHLSSNFSIEGPVSILKSFKLKVLTHIPNDHSYSGTFWKMILFRSTSSGRLGMSTSILPGAVAIRPPLSQFVDWRTEQLGMCKYSNDSFRRGLRDFSWMDGWSWVPRICSWSVETCQERKTSAEHERSRIWIGRSFMKSESKTSNHSFYRRSE